MSPAEALTPTLDVPDDELAIRLRGIANRFGPVTIHEGLELDILRGETVGIVGGSGTGKSVLLNSIIGLRRPSEGSVMVLALVQLLLAAKVLVEPSGAAALAVALRGPGPGTDPRGGFAGRRVGVLLSGGNVSPALVAELLAKHA